MQTGHPVAGDADLSELPTERIQEIVVARLATFQTQLYESLLNRAHAAETSATPEQIAELDQRIDGLRTAIALHRAEQRQLSERPQSDSAT